MDIEFVYRAIEYWQQSIANLTNGLKYCEINCLLYDGCSTMKSIGIYYSIFVDMGIEYEANVEKKPIYIRTMHRTIYII